MAFLIKKSSTTSWEVNTPVPLNLPNAQHPLTANNYQDPR